MSKRNDISSHDDLLNVIENKIEKISNDKHNNKINNIINPKNHSLEDKEANKQFLNQKRLFNVIYSDHNDLQIKSTKIKRKKDPHNELSSDNITTTIIRHFTNFVCDFINQSIKEGLTKNKEYSETIRFKKINNENKKLIKVKDIKKKSIKEFLFSKNENKIIYENLMQKIDYSFENLFKMQVLKLFYNIYNTNEKIINLEEYDVKGVKQFNLENVETIENLKEKIRNNNGQQKLDKLESIINSKFLKFFKVTKK